MDLFSVVRLAEPKAVNVGHRALRAGEAPILQATVGRVMELNLEEEGSGETPPHALDATPINVAEPDVQAQDAQPDAEKSMTESSESVEIIKVVDAPEEGSRGEKRKEPMSGGDGASSSRRKRRVISTATSSTEADGGDGSQAEEEGVLRTDTGKDATESPPHT